MSAAVAEEYRGTSFEAVVEPYTRHGEDAAMSRFNREAMRRGVVPACAGDPRFTAEASPGPAKASPLAGVCDQCPLRAACSELAETLAPVLGVWGGERRNKVTAKAAKSRKKTTEEPNPFPDGGSG
ncbi:MAG: WhiB family transcriptional regulator [Scrofimicrobium sp.]